MLQLLKADGYEVACQAFYGTQGGSIMWDGIQIYPAQGEPNGSDAIGHHAKDFNADLVITLYDIWAFPPDYNQRLDAKWLAWFPIDGAPASPANVDRAKRCDYPAVFSKDGVEQMARAGVKVDYLPYGIDCSVFKPGDKAAARDELGVPHDVFFVATVGANKGYPPRKAWPEILQGFKLFADSAPEARLYLHTRHVPISQQGIYFAPLLAELGLDDGRVSFVDPQALAIGVKNEDMATLYQAADVMLLPSMGEGFGLPIAEAQACGCPVITQRCSSMPELTIYGECIEPLQRVWNLGHYWWQVPSVERIADALKKIHWQTRCAPCSHGESYRRADKAVYHFRDNYDWPVVYARHWKPLLERIEAELW
jgi:glycosyltransferase involved in cell wall biosynthesis